MSGWPRVILHVDADAFFASVEQSRHPEYAGRPVVTGQERNIVAAASYEAKARGVKRGIALWDVRKLCPDCIILPSDYETYSLYSLRLFDLLRRYSPIVEEWSIDEAFVDLSGLSRLHRRSYRAVVEEIQARVRDELGIGVSIGVSITRSLAKMASKFRKPAGITMVAAGAVPRFLAHQKASDICGIGPSSTALLLKHGIVTAQDFVRLPEKAVVRLMGKIGLELWQELNGRAVFPFDTKPKSAQHSIMKSKTFSPSSSDREFVRAQLIRNLESACIKARRHELAANRLIVFLRYNLPVSQGRDSHLIYAHRSAETRLDRASSLTSELMDSVSALFDRCYRSSEVYRATGVVLMHLAPDRAQQYTLFDDPRVIERESKLYEVVDVLSDRYGKHTVSAGTGLFLNKRKVPSSRAVRPERKQDLLPGENFRQRLNLPLWKVPV